MNSKSVVIAAVVIMWASSLAAKQYPAQADSPSKNSGVGKQAAKPQGEGERVEGVRRLLWRGQRSRAMEVLERIGVAMGGGERAAKLQLGVEVGGHGGGCELGVGKRVRGTIERQQRRACVQVRRCEGGVDGDRMFKASERQIKVARLREEISERVVHRCRVRRLCDGMLQQVKRLALLVRRGESGGVGERLVG